MLVGKSHQRGEAKGTGKRHNVGQTVPEMDSRLPVTSGIGTKSQGSQSTPKFTVPVRRKGVWSTKENVLVR